MLSLNTRLGLLVCGLLLSSRLFGQMNRVEDFDTSGLPARPTNFTEQKLFDLIQSYRRGNLTEAAIIQRKLSEYYRDKGDTRRAREAVERGAPAGPPRSTPAGTPTPAPWSTSPPAPWSTSPPPPPPSGRADFTGHYYRMEGSTMHTWDFNPGGAFLHTIIARGVGTSVRNSEKGVFRLTGNTVELTILSSTTGFVTPAPGGRSAVIGGGHDSKPEVRRLPIQLHRSGGGITLDGLELKVKSW
jgi:hypothetical protein